MATIICDVDGTLLTKRADLRDDKKNWYTPRLDDELIVPVAQMIAKFWVVEHVEVVLLSGRKERYRDITLQTLEKYQWRYFDSLLMRKTEDNRPDEVIKKEIFDEHLKDREILFAIDDRPRIVRLWRSMGIFTFDVNQRGVEF